MFSVAAGREGRCRQISLARVGSTPSVPATLGLPRSRVCAFPVYTAQAPGCSIWSGPCGSSFQVLHKSADLVELAFGAFPGRAAQAARSLPGALSPGVVRLLPSAVPASVSTCASWVRLVSVLGSWSLAAGRSPPPPLPPADVNHPESQEVFG